MRILMIESNTTGIAAVKKVILAGYKVVFLTADVTYYRNCPDFSFLNHTDCLLVESCDVGSVDNCVALVKSVARDTQIDGVTTFSELHIVHVAAVANALGLPSMSVEAALNARHKHRTRLALANVPGVSQPHFAHVTSIDQLSGAVERVGYPCVIKPSDGTGSMAVVHLACPGDMEAYLVELNEYAEHGRSVQRTADLLVEQFVPGALVSVEACVRDGQVMNMGITDRLVSGFPHFIEMGCCYFRDHEQRDALFAMNEKVTKGLGIDFGFTHTEYFLTPGGPILCEINGRLAGGVVPSLMQISTGVDPQLEVVRLALGFEPKLSVVEGSVAAGRWFGATASGALQSVQFGQIEKSDGYVGHEVYRRSGDEIQALAKSNFDWLGHVIFTGDSPEEAYRRTEAALDGTVVSLHMGVAR